MKKITHSLVDAVFDGYTPTQKHNNVRFLHGMIVFLIIVCFIFAPSRSFARYLILTLYLIFAGLYSYFGVCWVSEVEKTLLDKSSYGATLDPMLSLLGIKKTYENREIVTKVGYLFVILVMLFLTIRDLFGCY